MSPETSPASSSDFTRLHISPLDPDLLKIVLPASVAPQARNVSYHTIETFPERRYGYVELPAMEAEKLKKKLNGAVLKGTKLRIEKARPEERVEPTGEVDEEEEKRIRKKPKDSAERSKKRKRDRDVVEGVTLTDRKVKRGWTEPADQRRKKSKKDKEKEKDGKHTEKKKRQKSKYTEQEECLLKTKVPLNAVANITDEDGQPRKRKKKGKSSSREVTVHEFEKTTKFPSFLKNSVPEDAPKTAVEFVEGKGWVDEDGDVVETVKTKKVAKTTPKKPKKVTPPPVQEAEESDDDSTSSSGTSSSGSSSDEEEEEEAVKTPKAVPQKDQDSSEDSSSDDDDDSPKLPEHATPLSAIKADASRPMSSSSSRSLTIKIPPPITPSSTKVHPLEALYKRSKPDENATEAPAAETQPFSFFGGGDEDDDIEKEKHRPVERTPAPMTPFTRQDIEWRNVRSAAPTPDTAHPSRMRNFWVDEEEDQDMADALREADQEHYDEDEEQEPAAAPAPGSSDFQAWFWDNRRDLNRSWMKRRKTAAKEKRHRENKARASKAV